MCCWVVTVNTNGLTRVPGLRVGHFTDQKAATGCTVVLCESGAVGGVDVRGAAPGTRETDILRPTSLVSRAHAILLSGGSAFGLDTASGVVRYLEQKGVGFRVGRTEASGRPEDWAVYPLLWSLARGRRKRRDT